MTWKHRLLALAALALVPSGLLGAEEQGPTPGPQLQTETGEYVLFPQRTPGSLEQSPYFVRGQSGFRQDAAFRFGWWGVSTDGNLNKVGEWQGLENSAFWDVDAITSDGYKTVDFTLTGTEDEALNTHWRYFSPGLSAEVDFGRFLHRLDHDSLANFQDTNGDGSYVGRFTDDFAGEDYAIRIQKLDAKFKGHLTENVKWGLNLWGMRKFGEREALAMNHGCRDGFCHLENNRQQINWLTMEIEPHVEARMGPVTVEYSRTMRAFQQNDETVTRFYNQDRGSRAITPGFDYPYAMTSENFTQIDRIKFGVDLTENTQFYANLFYGDTENKRVDIHRNFQGYDLRATNRSIDRLSLTAFAKRYKERTQRITDATGTDILSLNDPWGWNEGTHGITNASLLAEFRTPVGRTTTTAGFKGRWKPSRSIKGLAFTGGYEYRLIDRINATYPLDFPANGISSFTQPDTVSNMLHVGAQNRWSRCFDSFVRYKMRSIDNPLFGFSETQENVTSIGQALNSNQPQHEDLVELGGTWTPADSFFVNATFGLQQRNHNAANANFSENDYPIVVSAWYAPAVNWTISGGLGFFSNWIDQDIMIGKDGSIHGGGQEGATLVPFAYGGRAQVINLGSSYAASERLTLSGDFEFVESRNSFADPSFLGTGGPVDLSYIPGASDVRTETTRFSLGADYLLSRQISCYFQYQFYDWNDKAGNGESGTASMFLGGVTAKY